MKMKTMGVTLGLLGICFGLTAFSIFCIYWLASPVGLPCHSVTYDGTLDIESRFIGKEALFLSNRVSFPLAGKSVLLAGGSAREPGPLPITTFDGLPAGTPMRLEYCGPALVRVTMDDHEILKNTQKAVDHNRIRGMLQWGMGAIFGALLAILGRRLERRASADS